MIIVASFIGLTVSAKSLQIGKAVPVIAMTSVAANALTIARRPDRLRRSASRGRARAVRPGRRLRAGDRGGGADAGPGAGGGGRGALVQLSSVGGPIAACPIAPKIAPHAARALGVVRPRPRCAAPTRPISRGQQPRCGRPRSARLGARVLLRSAKLHLATLGQRDRDRARCRHHPAPLGLAAIRAASEGQMVFSVPRLRNNVLIAAARRSRTASHRAPPPGLSALAESNLRILNPYAGGGHLPVVARIPHCPPSRHQLLDQLPTQPFGNGRIAGAPAPAADHYVAPVLGAFGTLSHAEIMARSARSQRCRLDLGSRVLPDVVAQEGSVKSTVPWPVGSNSLGVLSFFSRFSGV